MRREGEENRNDIGDILNGESSVELIGIRSSTQSHFRETR